MREELAAVSQGTLRYGLEPDCATIARILDQFLTAFESSSQELFAKMSTESKEEVSPAEAQVEETVITPGAARAAAGGSQKKKNGTLAQARDDATARKVEDLMKRVRIST